MSGVEAVVSLSGGVRVSEFWGLSINRRVVKIIDRRNVINARRRTVAM